MAKKETLKPFIRSWEGGFANDKYDRGGATKWGVTIGTFRSVYGKSKTVQDLKNMTEEQWDHIFKVLFWDKCRADEIKSQSVANLIVDWVWASGGLQLRKIQKIVGVSVDGVVGPKTIAAINDYAGGARALFDKIKVNRAAFINAIAVGSQARYKRGWSRRLSAIQWGKLICNGGEEIDF